MSIPGTPPRYIRITAQKKWAKQNKPNSLEHPGSAGPVDGVRIVIAW